MYYSPLRYPGGKVKLSQYLKKIIELNNMKGCSYIEPYVGGAGAALHLLFAGEVKNIFINDYDRSIYSFWFSILHYKDEFIQRIIKCPINVSEWYKQKEIQQNKKTADLFSLGFSTFFLNRVNRSGIIKGGLIGGKGQDSIYKMDCRFNKKNLIDRIEKISLYKDRIKVYNLDAVDFILEIVNNLTEECFVFLDPPYYKKGKGLYTNFYNHDDHLNIFDVVSRKLEKKWILTYDNTPEIKEIYKSNKKLEFSLNYSANRNYKGSELLIYNDLKLPIEKIETFFNK